jgi:hypothetical protein
MRAAVLSLLLVLAGCVTASAPNERVAGCWISRDGETTTTMRWLPNRDGGDTLRGDRLIYAPNAEPRATSYTLGPGPNGVAFCTTGDTARCWRVAAGASGSLQGGRAFIDAHGERLRISVVNDTGGERVVFNGRRDGCD